MNENLVPCIGDVQFQAFISFSWNQIKWAKAYNKYQRRELGMTSGLDESHRALCAHLSIIKSLQNSLGLLTP